MPPFMRMITRNSLKALKTELNELIKVIDINLDPLVKNEKLFDTQSDYYESLRNQNRVPQDYYKFRFFDNYIYIYYNLRFKIYEIRIEDSEGRFYIKSTDVSFERLRLSFIDVVSEFLEKEKDKLFKELPQGLF